MIIHDVKASCITISVIFVKVSFPIYVYILYGDSMKQYFLFVTY